MTTTMPTFLSLLYFKHEGAAIRRFLSTWLNSQIKFSERKKSWFIFTDFEKKRHVCNAICHTPEHVMDRLFSFNSFAIYHNPLRTQVYLLPYLIHIPSHHLPVIIKWSMCKEGHFDGRTTNTKDNILVGLMHEKKSLKR